MKDIKYKIEFFSMWHCGSGLAGGAEKDISVLKDKNRLPYIPGKTIKGLIREALENIICFTGKSDLTSTIIQSLGNSEDHDLRDNVSGQQLDAMQKGNTYFTNACLDENERQAIVSNGLADYLYQNTASTAINPDGIAEDHSLRAIECTIPCVLYGEIQSIPDNIYEEYTMALNMIKRLGTNRNRGLGRCKITVLACN